MRVGVFGGTFDPPHLGHVELARTAIERLRLDELIVVPAARNPQKNGRPQTSPAERLSLVSLAMQDLEKVSISDVDIARGGPSYTVDTLEMLQQARPGSYWFLMGADAFLTFPNWHRVDRILRLSRLAVALRPPHTMEEMATRVPELVLDRCDFLRMEPWNISSSKLRERLRLGMDMSQWLPATVAEAIESRGLYQP